MELLAYYFLDRYCRQNGKAIQSIAEPVMEVLEAYDFPGNLRELENIIASAVVLETGDVLSLSSLPPHLRAAGAKAEARVPREVRKTLADLEEEHIRAVIDLHQREPQRGGAHPGHLPGRAPRQAQAARHRRGAGRPRRLGQA